MAAYLGNYEERVTGRTSWTLNACFYSLLIAFFCEFEILNGLSDDKAFEVASIRRVTDINLNHPGY